jgi:VanZ family protein
VPDLRTAPDPAADYVLRKLGHMVVFGILAVLVAWAWPWRRPIAAAFVLTVLYAATDELHQSFVPGRYGDPLDVAIDAAGAAIGLAAWSAARGRLDA